MSRRGVSGRRFGGAVRRGLTYLASPVRSFWTCEVCSAKLRAIALAVSALALSCSYMLRRRKFKALDYRVSKKGALWWGEAPGEIFSPGGGLGIMLFVLTVSLLGRIESC